MTEFVKHPIPADKFTDHEILDRAYMLMDMWENYMLNHPALHNHPDLQALAESIGDQLGDYYQRCGAKFI